MATGRTPYRVGSRWVAAVLLWAFLGITVSCGGDDSSSALPDAVAEADGIEPSSEVTEAEVGPHNPGDASCQPQRPEGNEAWSRKLVEWRSVDGTTFTEHRTFQWCADVPSLASDGTGTVIAAFQGFANRDVDARWDKVAVRISRDNAKSWGDVQFIEKVGFPEGSVRPFDPTITYDAGLQRWRLYVSMSLGSSPVLDDTFCTHSALSDDGVTYTYEDDARFCSDGRPVIDPAVGWLDGLWYYSAPRGAPQDGAFFASSVDGLTFTEKASIVSDNNHVWTGNFIAVNGALRFYGAEALIPSGNVLWWAETTDSGQTWSAYTQTNVPAGKDPGILKLPDGTFMLLVPTRTD